MTRQRFIKPHEIEDVAEQMRATLEVTPLSYHHKVELATELATETYGFTPRRSLILLIVKHADLNWRATQIATRRALELLND